MDNNTLKCLSDNLRLLMDHHKQSQEDLAVKSGLSQRTISNMLTPGATKKGPNIENISAVARAYKLETWHLLIPGQPIELLLSKSVEKLLENYTKVEKHSRDNLDRIAENELRYCMQDKKIINGN